MIKNTWNKNELIQQFTHQKNLSEVIQKLEEEAIKEGKVICSISINNLFLSEEDEEKFSQTTLEEINSLTITLEKPQKIFKNILIEWINKLPKLIKAIDNIAEEIRFENSMKTMKSFYDIIDNCSFLVASLKQVKIYSINNNNNNNNNFPYEKWKKEEIELQKNIKKILHSWESQDFIHLSDLLEYNLNTSLENWYQLLKSIKDLQQ